MLLQCNNQVFITLYTAVKLTVASLGLVSPGAATDGVSPHFFLKKSDDLFLVIALKVMTLTQV